jgi:hypothetical protein
VDSENERVKDEAAMKLIERTSNYRRSRTFGSPEFLERIVLEKDTERQLALIALFEPQNIRPATWVPKLLDLYGKKDIYLDVALLELFSRHPVQPDLVIPAIQTQMVKVFEGNTNSRLGNINFGLTCLHSYGNSKLIDLELIKKCLNHSNASFRILAMPVFVTISGATKENYPVLISWIEEFPEGPQRDNAADRLVAAIVEQDKVSKEYTELVNQSARRLLKDSTKKARIPAFRPLLRFVIRMNDLKSDDFRKFKEIAFDGNPDPEAALSLALSYLERVECSEKDITEIAKSLDDLKVFFTTAVKYIGVPESKKVLTANLAKLNAAKCDDWIRDFKLSYFYKCSDAGLYHYLVACGATAAKPFEPMLKSQMKAADLPDTLENREAINEGLYVKRVYESIFRK